MIRELINDDLKSIDSIGSLIKDDFLNKNKINERLKLDYVKIFVFVEENIVKGFIEIETHFEVVEIINIAVDKTYQHKGIATTLINYIVDNYTCEKIILEVREDNLEALNLYKKNNFKEINRRKKYYGNVDAIIMERELV